ncbi:DUF742 domain-containing protein [Streptodolium elevatio]|uniref:DUF742 domain-containing protein n=1 Tax=Streptodolium elevatio TaxID=3157996 RepID=A0ABV3DJS5_9ACTN
MTSGAGGGGHTRRGVVRSHTVISPDTDTPDHDGTFDATDGPAEVGTAYHGGEGWDGGTGYEDTPKRGRPRVDMATLLSLAPAAPAAGLPVQARRVLALLEPGVLSVAEVSARLELPGGVVRAVAAGLVAGGHVRAADPFVPRAQPHERDFLERVLHGLQRL